MMKRYGEPVVWWALLAVPITLLALLVAIVSQQVYRQSLNDPQLQMAEDAALALGKGAQPADIVLPDRPLVDLRTSLAPWMAVYDSSGLPLGATGQFDGAPPQMPKGVFDTSGWNALVIGHHLNPEYHLNGSPVMQERFTWQPSAGVRQAVVLAQSPDKKYFVASGRSMRDVEQRIEHENELIFVGWLGTLAATLIACIFAWLFLRRA